MSDSERKRRLAYKQNRKKWIRIQSVIALILAIIVIASVFTYYKLNQTYYIDYNENADVDYKIYLDNNEFYDEEYIGEDNAYVTSLVNKIIADFKYELNIEADGVEYEYSYKLDTVLTITDTDSEDKVILEKIYPIIAEQSFKEDSNKVLITEQVAIDYQQYNEFANKFFDDLMLRASDFDTKISAVMSVNVKSASDAFVSDKNNAYSISLDAPLTLDTFKIEIPSSVPDGEKVLACKNAYYTAIFKDVAICGGLVDALILTVLIIFIFITRNDDINYTNKIKRLCRSYGSFIQKIKNDFSVDGYQILYVDTFREMLGIRDTIMSPILMFENEDQTMTRFFIPTASNVVYVHEIKVDNYDELYAISDSEGEPLDLTVADEAVVAEHVPETVEIPGEAVTLEEAVKPVLDVDACEIVDDEPISATIAEPAQLEAVAEEDAEVVSSVPNGFNLDSIQDIIEIDNEDGGEEDGPTAISYIDENGNISDIKCSRSFTANLIQSNSTVKQYYAELKNHILSYKGVKARTSWRMESYNKGRIQLFKLKIRGKTICLYCALDPDAFDKAKYFHERSEAKVFKKVPMMVRIKSDRGLKKAKELVDIVMSRFAIELNANAGFVDYSAEYPYETTKSLVGRGLIKLLFPDAVLAEPKRDEPKQDEHEHEERAHQATIEVVNDEQQIEEITIFDTDAVDMTAVDVALHTATPVLSEIDYVDEPVEEFTETDESHGVDVIGVVWPERPERNKVYRYDPNGETVEEGDIVLVPTRDASRNREVIRKAAVAHANHKVLESQLHHPLKKIIGIVKRRLETALAPETEEKESKKIKSREKESKKTKTKKK